MVMAIATQPIIWQLPHSQLYVTQCMKRYQVLAVELELPLHMQMITEHIKRNFKVISCHFPKISGFI